MTRWCEEAGLAVDLERHPVSRGFSAAVNAGLIVAIRSGASTALVLNSDTILLPGSTERLFGALDDFPELAAVGPLSNAAGAQSLPSVRTGLRDRLMLRTALNDISPAVLQQVHDRMMSDRAFFVPDGAPFLRVGRLHGFALTLRTHAVESVGMFDERAFPSGYGVETDLSLKLRASGHSVAVVPDAFVWHSRGGSTRALTRARGVLRARRELLRRYPREALTEARMWTDDALRLPELRALASTLQCSATGLAPVQASP
jgi:GT2 family glycosyltransferase